MKHWTLTPPAIMGHPQTQIPGKMPWSKSPLSQIASGIKIVDGLNRRTSSDINFNISIYTCRKSGRTYTGHIIFENVAVRHKALKETFLEQSASIDESDMNISRRVWAFIVCTTMRSAISQ
jgi:hypothetical protein